MYWNITGRAFNTIIYNVFHERHIEVMLYCVWADTINSRISGCRITV